MGDPLAMKHILHPKGDVIIHLRNFDAPFAVLQENEELYVPTKPKIDLFGSLNHSVDVPKRQTGQSQSPNNELEHKPEMVALGPGENTVTSEAQEEKPAAASPEIWFQVSSAHLTLASPYFERALDGPFKESQPGIDGLRYVDASDWDPIALLIVLQIIHGRNRQVPRSLNLEMLAKVAVIVDYYRCYEIVDAFAEIWFQRIKGSLVLGSLDRDLILVLQVSLVFSWADEFKAATRIAMLQSKGPLRTLDLPIPENVISTINDRRTNALRKVNSVLESLTARLQMPRPYCSDACASLNLGAILRQIHNNKELNGLGMLFASLDGKSVALTVEAAHHIYTPGGTHKHATEFCNLNRLVRSEMNKLERLDGLSLGDFVQTV